MDDILELGEKGVKLNIYVAASFCYTEQAKTSQHKYIIEKIVNRIGSTMADKGIEAEFYLPHLFKVQDAWDMSLEEWSRKVYEKDLLELTGSNIVIFLSFGKENNDGAAWEVGFVNGINFSGVDEKIPVVVVKLTDEPESLMISNSCSRIITADEIEDYDWETLPEYKTDLEKLG